MGKTFYVVEVVECGNCGGGGTVVRGDCDAVCPVCMGAGRVRREVPLVQALREVLVAQGEAVAQEVDPGRLVRHFFEVKEEVEAVNVAWVRKVLEVYAARGDRAFCEAYAKRAVEQGWVTKKELGIKS